MPPIVNYSSPSAWVKLTKKENFIFYFYINQVTFLILFSFFKNKLYISISWCTMQIATSQALRSLNQLFLTVEITNRQCGAWLISLCSLSSLLTGSTNLVIITSPGHVNNMTSSVTLISYIIKQTSRKADKHVSLHNAPWWAQKFGIRQ